MSLFVQIRTLRAPLTVGTAWEWFDLWNHITSKFHGQKSAADLEPEAAHEHSI